MIVECDLIRHIALSHTGLLFLVIQEVFMDVVFVWSALYWFLEHAHYNNKLGAGGMVNGFLDLSLSASISLAHTHVP